MSEAFQELLSNPLVIRGIAAVGGLIVLLRVASHYISHYVDDPDLRYRARKATSVVGWAVFLVFVAALFSDRLGGVTVAFGVAGAGIAFALQEVIVSLASRVAISFGNSFGVGDRVQLGGTMGDVIDVGLLRSTIMECGEWVTGDNYSGRIVRVANSFAFEEPVIFEETVANCILALDIAEILGTDTIRLDPRTSLPPQHADDSDLDYLLERVCEGMQEVTDAAANRGITVGVENHGRLLGRTDPPHEDEADDWTKTHADEWIQRVVGGEGDVQWPELFSIIHDAGYDGNISLEISLPDDIFGSVRQGVRNRKSTIAQVEGR